MRIYRFSTTSPIKEISFRCCDDDTPVAWLTAANPMNPNQLSAIRKAIEDQGWQCVPTTVGEQDVLQVIGFKKEEHCAAFLADRGFTTGDPQILDETNDAAKRSWISRTWRYFKHNSLQWAGIFNLIGDVGFLGNGIKNRDAYKITGGSLYTVGGANLTLFGRVREGHGLREVSENTAEFVKQKTNGLPEDSALARVDALKHEGTLSDTKDFLHRNAAHNTLGLYTAGAGAMLLSGIKKKEAGQGSAGFYYGLSSVIFKAASLLVPEKSKNDENKKEATSSAKPVGFFAKIINWIREKPLRIFGYGSLVTDSLLALETYQEYKFNPKKSGYVWTGVTAVTYILADIMIAISHKDHNNANGKFDVEEQRRIEALAAEAIAREPKKTHGELIRQVAEFLATQPLMDGDAATIGASLKQQVEHMGHNPWAARVTTNLSLQPNR